MDDNGWIKIYRILADWEWYTDSHMVHLYIHLLISANSRDKRWRGIEVKRGQLVTSLDKLHAQTGISVRSLRTCLERLESTGEIEQKTTNAYRLITICKYGIYQAREEENDKLPTSERQTSDKQPTSERQATDNKQEYKKERIKENICDESRARERSEFESQEDEISEEEGRVLGYQTEILKSQLTVEQTCMTLHLTPTQYQGLIQDFTAEQLAKGTAYLGYSEYRRHAYDWIRAHIAANEIDQDGHTAGNTNKAKITKGQSNGSNGHEQLTPKQKFIREFEEKQREDYQRMGVDITKIQQTADGTDVF